MKGHLSFKDKLTVWKGCPLKTDLTVSMLDVDIKSNMESTQTLCTYVNHVIACENQTQTVSIVSIHLATKFHLSKKLYISVVQCYHPHIYGTENLKKRVMSLVYYLFFK